MSVAGKELISIIIPVYNVENWLQDCLESVLLQSYKNIEIIIVNDGSTDGSACICKKIMEKDNRVQYYEKNNSGQSDTRNIGIEKATGKYIMFVDSDDLMEKNTVEYLYEILVRKEVQIACSDLAHFIDGAIPKYRHASQLKVFDSKDALCSFMYQKDISTSPCGKLFRADLWEDIRFPSGKLFEDNVVLYKILMKSDKVLHSNAQYYGYRHRSNSTTTKEFSEKDLYILEIGKEIMEVFNNMDEDLVRASLAYQSSNCLRIYLNATEDEQYVKALDYCKEFLDRNCKNVLKDRKIRKKLCFALLLYWMRIPKKCFGFIHSKVKRWS